MVMAAALFPEAQTKVQEELDAVIGNDRGMFQPFLWDLDTSFENMFLLQLLLSMIKNSFRRQLHLRWRHSVGDLLATWVRWNAEALCFI